MRQFLLITFIFVVMGLSFPSIVAYKHKHMIGVQADQTNTSSGVQQKAQRTGEKYVLSQKLIGSAVWSRLGEKLGRVEGMVIDTENGRIAQVVLSPVKQATGSNEKLVAVPWQKFEVTPGPKLVLNAKKGTLAKAPNFPRKRLPEFTGVEFNERMFRWWEVPTGAPFISGRETGS